MAFEIINLLTYLLTTASVAAEQQQHDEQCTCAIAGNKVVFSGIIVTISLGQM